MERTLMCDNTVVVNAINSQSGRGESIDPIQLIFLTAALYDIEVSSQWLSSKDNWIADALSRFKIYKFADVFLLKMTTPVFSCIE